MSVNKWIGIGNLGKDPETRQTNSGKTVCTFSIACQERKDGPTEWVNVVTWEKLAEICGQYLEKGKQVYIEGRMQTRSWDNADGAKQYKTEIVAHQMQMLGGRSQNENQGSKTEDITETAKRVFDDSGEIPF